MESLAQETSSLQVGLMLGSYNPPHLAHVETADRLRRAGGLKEIWMMPIPQSPYKKDVEQVPFKDKIKMCEIVAEPHQEWLKVSDVCADFPPDKLGQLQQYKRTMEGLMQSHCGVHFSIVAGEDFSHKYQGVTHAMAYLGMMCEAFRHMTIFQSNMIGQFADRIVKANEIFQKLTIMSAPRTTFCMTDEEGREQHGMEMSSSVLREAIRSGADHVFGIPDALMRYILQQGFYRQP